MSRKTFRVPYQDGELVLRVKTSEENYTKLHVSYETEAKKQKILCFYPEICNTKLYGDISFGVYDSEREELGEIVHQMHFNNRVDRKPFPYGILLCVTELQDPKGKELFGDEDYICSVEFMDALASLSIQYLRSLLKKRAHPLLPLYFIYYGMSEVDYSDYPPLSESSMNKLEEIPVIDSKLLDAFKESKKFCAFFCREAACSSERFYLAVAGETNNPEYTDRLISPLIRAAELWPETIRPRYFDDEDDDFFDDDEDGDEDDDEFFDGDDE